MNISCAVAEAIIKSPDIYQLSETEYGFLNGDIVLTMYKDEEGGCSAHTLSTGV